MPNNNTNINNNNVMIYVRVSSQKQATSTNVSIPAQTNECMTYAASRNYCVKSIIQDVGSAYLNNKQPNLTTAINNLAANNPYNITKLVVYTHDRFSRNLQFALEMLSLMTKHNIILETVIDNIDYQTPLGRHNLNNAFSLGQLNSHITSMKVKSAIQYKNNVVNNMVNNMVDNVANVIEPTTPNIQQVIDKFIIALRFATMTSRQLSELLYTIVSEDQRVPIIFREKVGDHDRVIERVRPHAITYQEIADLLNDYGVRDTMITSVEVRRICHKNLLSQTMPLPMATKMATRYEY